MIAISKIVSFLALIAAATASAQSPITIGEQHLLPYAEEAEPREINVALPAGYGAGEALYPVVYLIDGGLDQDFLHVTGTAALNALWGRSEEAIIIGVETRERRAELVGTPGNGAEQFMFPEAGHAADFRAFIRDEVMPLVERTYRTNGTQVVIGESLAGLFIVETWLEEPDMFDGYGAVNPSLWWQDQALARDAAKTLQDGQARGPLMLTFSNEGEDTEAAVRMVAAAAGKGACLLPRADLTHATAYHVLTPTLLQFLLPTGYEFEPEWGFDIACAQTEAED